MKLQFTLYIIKKRIELLLCQIFYIEVEMYDENQKKEICSDSVTETGVYSSTGDILIGNIVTSTFVKYGTVCHNF